DRSRHVEAGPRLVRGRLDQAGSERRHRHEKPDAVETVTAMIEDVASGAVGEPTQPEAGAAEALVRARQPDAVTYADWRALDALELANGKSCGRPRLKYTTVQGMLAALGRAGSR